MPPPDELRVNPRAPLRLRIDYDRMNAFFADYTKNISKGGTFIKTTRPLDVGSRCQFALSLPALSEPLMLEGEVVWTLTPELARGRGGAGGAGRCRGPPPGPGAPTPAGPSAPSPRGGPPATISRRRSS